MTQKILLLILSVMISLAASAQVGINTITPDPSAALDVTATDKGLLIPRVALASAIPSPAAGLMVHQTTAPAGFYYHNGTAWTMIGSGSASELEKITEGGKTGHRILGRNPLNYGDIGNGAFDLSLSLFSSTTNGATGTYSTAMGYGTNASGTNTLAIGEFTVASGSKSFASGNYSQASGANSSAKGVNTKSKGYSSEASGEGTIAKGFAEVAIGAYNDTLTTVNEFFYAQDSNRVFTVGNGTNFTGTPVRKTAFVIQQDGNVGINQRRPSEKLDIAGSIKIVDGTQAAGKVLTSDANGKASWQTASSGSPSELQKITEAGKTGHRILGRNPLNYGDIGIDAIDLSLSPGQSPSKGATGDYSTSLGYNTTASGFNSTAMGSTTVASGQSSIAMGITASATGLVSTAMGSGTTASGQASTAMGNNTTALADYSTAMGFGTTASGVGSTAMGGTTTASGQVSTAMGNATTASGINATAMGNTTTASGVSSTTTGESTTAKSFAETTVGSFNTDYTPAGTSVHQASDRAFGVGIGASGAAKKDGLIVYKDGTLAFNKLTAAPATTTDRFYVLNNKLNYNGAEVGGSELQKITEGGNTGWRILGRLAASYGNIGDGAIDLSSEHYEGGGSYPTSTTKGATGLKSMAMGNSTTSSGIYSTAMGQFTTASGQASTSMGQFTTASGTASTSLGIYTTASGTASTSMGIGTTASSFAETTVGSYNTDYAPAGTGVHSATDRAFGVGIGSNVDAKKDGLIVYKSGNTFISNEGNQPADGNASIIPGYGAGALQVRASGDGFNLRTGTGNNSMNIAKASTPSNGNTYMSFGHLGSGNYTEIGGIKANGSTGINYNTSSDMRLKSDKGMFADGLSTIKAIKIHNYIWKANNVTDLGVFAQELYKVYPNAVTKGDDTEVSNITDIEKTWQVDYSKLVPVLIAATQELSKKIEELEAKNANLTSQVKEMASLKSDIEIIKAQLGLDTKTTVANK